MPDVLLEEHLPSRSVPRSRPYSNVVFEPSTALIVAASVIQAKFASFDEDGNRLWEPDGVWLFPSFVHLSFNWIHVFSNPFHFIQLTTYLSPLRNVPPWN